MSIYDTLDLSPSQRWVATGEAIAHLKYREEKKIIQSEMPGRNIVFSLNLNHTT
jgi:hypothetical protein